MRKLAFSGPISQRGTAYDRINTALVQEWQALGHAIYENRHGSGNEIAPVLFAHEYPPQTPNITHGCMVTMTHWEFTGRYSYPLSKANTLNTYSRVLTSSAWTASILAPQLEVEVESVRLGVDTGTFTSRGKHYDRTPLGIPDDAKIMLWLGGTDPRHNLQQALDVLDKLPEEYWLIVKLSAHYPNVPAQHPRAVVLRADLDDLSLASLYRLADVFLLTATGVGFSLPVLEALACGTAVVSTPLPPVLEIASEVGHGVVFADGGKWKPTTHPHYNDCVPWHMEVGADAIVKAISKAQAPNELARETIRKRYAWPVVAREIWEATWR